MHIKRLELYGFKSFPNRVSLVFPRGISAIVGPNGSGKSNIIDALRWILGEQNPRLLRVREMTDLIFAGENGRRPEFAEVRLILANEEGKGPKDFAKHPEISVVRRLYRDGESEFLINNRPCRLKDIVYLFLDTGAHARGYGIIDQGQIGQFVDHSPRERRRFLEEVAGIARYKLKREEAERQLSRTRQNLTRIKDILLEVEDRLEELRKQAEKTRAYLKLQEEIRKLELTRLQILYERNQNKRKKLLEKLKSLKEDLEQLESKTARLEPERDEKLALLELLQQELRELEARLQEKGTSLRKEETALEKLLREENSLARGVAQLEGQLSGKKERLRQIKIRLQEIRAEKEEVQKKLANLQKQKVQLEREYQNLKEKRQQIDAELQKLREEAFHYKHILKTKLKERERLKTEYEAIETKKLNLAEKIETIQKQKAEIEAEIERLQRERQELEDSKGEIISKRQAEEKLLSQGEEKLSELKEQEASLRLKRKEILEEIKWLKGFLLKARPEAAKILESKGIEASLLFEVLNLSPEEEKLAELAYPEILEALWFNEETELSKALATLEEKGLSALIYLGKDPQTFILKRLARVKICEKLSPPEENQDLFVTPEGHLLEPDGLLHLRGKRNPSLLKKLRELQEKENTFAELERHHQEIREHLGKLSREIQEKRKELESLKAKEKELSDRIRSIEDRLSRLVLQQEKLFHEEKFFLERKEELSSKAEECQEKLDLLEKEIAELSARKEEIHPQIKELEEKSALLDKEGQEVTDRLRKIEISISANEEREKHLLQEEERLLKEEAKLRQETEKLQQRIGVQKKNLLEIKARLQELKKSLESKRRELIQLKKELTHKRELYQRYDEEWRQLNLTLEKANEELKSQQKRLHRLEIDLAEVELTLKHLSEQAREKFGLSLPLEAVPHDISLSSVEERLRELHREFEKFGPVNLAAIEELEKTEERHRFLLEQKADLEKAISDLEEAVRQINRKCRSRLREALRATNEKLKLVFPHLFPGGQAELRFTESEDPLEAGLDLAVKLPGKPIRHLSMLSGGEKALTALAVLCAFYLVNPGPFCVLDEVDAPLDEANTARFVKLLRELNRYSQIILVTHNKQVMEAADALIGVTMEEKGISKVVSVTLT